MAPPRRAPANSNVIKLNLDPMTFDQLKAEAARRKDTMERTAYALLQLALAAAPKPQTAEPALDLPGIDITPFTSPRNPSNNH